MKKEIVNRRVLHRTHPLIFLGLALTLVVLISCASCGKPSTEKGYDNRIVQRIYSICPVLWGDVISVDLNEKGQVVSFGAFNYDLMPEDEALYNYDFTFTYDESGKIVGGKSIFGDLTEIKYDDQGRIIKSSFAIDGSINKQLLFVTYDDDGGSTWSFPTQREHVLGTNGNIPTIVFDKYWRCVGGCTKITKMEITAVGNTLNVKFEDGKEWIATYDDNNLLLSLSSAEDNWEYQFNDSDYCLSAISNNTRALCEYDKHLSPTSTEYYENAVLSKRITKKYDDLHRPTQYIIEEFESGREDDKFENDYEYHGDSNTMKRHSHSAYENGKLCETAVLDFHENGKAAGEVSTTYSSKGYKERCTTARCDENGNLITSEWQWFYENGQVKTHQINVFDGDNISGVETFEYDKDGNLTDHTKTSG